MIRHTRSLGGLSNEKSIKAYYMERDFTPEISDGLCGYLFCIRHRILLCSTGRLGNGLSGLQTQRRIFGSKFVGLAKFKFLFSDDVFLRDIRNTLAMGVLNLVTTFLMAIIFAILLNEVRNMFGKKLVQTVSYLPHFLSWIVVTGILHDALSSTGIINEMLVNLGILNSPINFFANPGYFWPIVAFANVWKETGWNAIVYLAAITSIDPSLYEAATLDGAGRWGKIWHVTLPGIKSTIMILLIMNIGNVLNAGFEVQYLLGNGLVKSVSETIDIYTLTWGISQNDYSLGTAAGIFKSVVAIILILGANWIAKRAGEDRLF